jgi:hypothetical protein
MLNRLFESYRAYGLFDFKGTQSGSAKFKPKRSQVIKNKRKRKGNGKKK